MKTAPQIAFTVPADAHAPETRVYNFPGIATIRDDYPVVWRTGKTSIPLGTLQRLSVRAVRRACDIFPSFFPADFSLS